MATVETQNDVAIVKTVYLNIYFDKTMSCQLCYVSLYLVNKRASLLKKMIEQQ